MPPFSQQTTVCFLDELFKREYTWPLNLCGFLSHREIFPLACMHASVTMPSTILFYIQKALPELSRPLTL